MKGKIYKITNLVNGKVYIGQTIQTLKQRWWRHCCNKGRVCPYLHHALLKYGKENFKIELIEEVDYEALNDTERFYISYYKSNDKRYGYNLTEGGSGVGFHKRLLSEKEELEIIALKESGLGGVEIAKRYNIDKGTVKNIFNRHNKKMPNKRNLEDRVDIEKFRNYILTHYPTCAEVEHEFEICMASVYHILKKLKDPRLKLRLKKRRSNADIHAEEVIQKYKEGYNIQDLIRIFHSPKRYISKVLHNANIQIQRGRKPIEYNISKSVPALAGYAEG